MPDLEKIGASGTSAGLRGKGRGLANGCRAVGVLSGTAGIVLTLLLAVGCDRGSSEPDAAGMGDDAGREVDRGPDRDWPPLLELEPPSFVESEGGGLVVPSTDGQTSLVVHEGALYLERASGDRTLLLGAAELAHGDEALELGTPREVSFAGRRALFERGSGVTEWYEPVVSGIEQGWTIAEAPGGAVGRLQINLGIGSEVKATQHSPGLIGFRVGPYTVHYGTLIARDRDGEELSSSMSLVDGAVVMKVDAEWAAYPVEVDPLVIVSSQQLTPPDILNERYGVAASVFGNVAVVGDPYREKFGYTSAGAVHVFLRGSNDSWSFSQTIRPGFAVSDESEFGASVDVFGNVLIVGAPGEDNDRGAVYLIDLAGGFHYVEESDDPSYVSMAEVRLQAPVPSTSHRFGQSVAVSDYRAIVGNAGSSTAQAYTYVWTHGWNWAHEATLSPTMMGDFFGYDVDVDPEDPQLVVVGAPGEGDGVVLVFDGCCSPAPPPALIHQPLEYLGFGASVAVSGRLVIIGSVTPDLLAEAWVMTGGDQTWMAAEMFQSDFSGLSDDVIYDDSLARPDYHPAVAIDGHAGVAMLGFPNSRPEDGSANEGSVDVPDLPGLTLWESDGMVRRGRVVETDGSTALIGWVAVDEGEVFAYNLRVKQRNGESCSSHSNCLSGFCVDGVCCNTSCGSGSSNDCQACSIAAGGTTDGTCTPLSAAVAPTVECRPSSGPCDVADFCSSSATSCPNAFEPASTVCGSASESCEVAAKCTGSSAACPANAPAPAGTSCGPVAGPCDVEDYCDGVSFACPSELAPAGTVCGIASQPCEVAAVCTGSSAACPANTPAPAGTACGPAPAGPCDLPDECDGSSFACPALFVAAGTVCLPADGECDAPDKCTGSSAECPATFLSGNTCRPAVDDCDIAEQCSGAAADCPPDETIPMCVPEICGNGIDDDLDGDTDCFDDDCASHPTCGSTELSCSDGIDNDADGLVDCEDVDECPTGSECSAGGDEICVAAACVARGCGDGFREHPGTAEWPREACEDGNTDPNDACSETCEPTRVAVWSAAHSDGSPGPAPSIAADGSGTLLVVFTEDVGSRRSVMARRFSPIGAALDSSPLQLDADVGLGWDAEPTVAGSASGGWLVVWTDPSMDGDGAGIATRRVMGNGTLGPVVVANSTTLGTQREGRVVGLNSGYAVVWTDESGLDGPLGESLLQARHFDHAGTPVGSDWVITETGRVASQPALAASGDRWVAAWTDAPAWTSGGSNVAARRFGGVAGDDAAPFVASPSDGAEPALAILESGAFALTWVQRSSDPLGDIATRILAPSGDALAGSSVSVLTGRDGEGRPYAQGAPSITGRTGSDFVVAYEDGGARRGVRFATVGSVLPGESSTLEQLLLNGFQGDASLMAAPGGTWFVWSDARDDGPGDPAAYRSVLAYLLPLD